MRVCIFMSNILEIFFGFLEIFGGVDADGFDVGDGCLDCQSVFEPTKLFERFGKFERCLLQLGDFAKSFNAIGIDADVLVVGVE